MAVTTPQQTEPNRLLLISVPRTASNLLLKVLNIANQPNVLTSPKGGYFFFDAFMASGKDGRLNKPLSQWTETDRTEVQNAFQSSIDSLEVYSARARAENKIMFAKEHAFWFTNPGVFSSMIHGSNKEEDKKSFRVTLQESYGAPTFSAHNDTILPDQYLRTWKLAFIIRHPALAWPSMYRAMQKISQAGYIDEDGIKGMSMSNMSMSWTRRLFDWAMEQPDVPTQPLVIDANDVIHNPAAVVKFCELAGLDSAAMQFEWGGVVEKKSESWSQDRAPTSGDAAELERQRKAAAIMLATLEGSTGIVKDKTPLEVDVDVEVAKWKSEFGDEAAALLEKATRDAMDDYEYLTERRVKV
ncbi:hypothetical protein N7508_010127 [Penicillium antarcticum]|uniref:uncharacterized protein n=1 Tax=Penicillium antarcticum TaxID=416450 RepID=UPI0023A475C4|nr:uncharacterized protein N7508_010127 [Penicillium antarcticum]KAJ5295306.1 hypothetical protein N7508_010127 [Penicillium antarcticum]